MYLFLRSGLKILQYCQEKAFNKIIRKQNNQQRRTYVFPSRILSLVYPFMSEQCCLQQRTQQRHQLLSCQLENNAYYFPETQPIVMSQRKLNLLVAMWNAISPRRPRLATSCVDSPCLCMARTFPNCPPIFLLCRLDKSENSGRLAQVVLYNESKKLTYVIDDWIVQMRSVQETTLFQSCLV